MRNKPGTNERMVRVERASGLVPEGGRSQVRGIFLALLLALVTAAGMHADQPDRQRSKTVAVMLWTGLAILSVTLLGIGLVWGVIRAARMIRKRREPVHTDMRDIWFLNPPGKRKQDES
jgi:hypothetical protein